MDTSNNNPHDVNSETQVCISQCGFNNYVHLHNEATDSEKHAIDNPNTLSTQLPFVGLHRHVPHDCAGPNDIEEDEKMNSPNQRHTGQNSNRPIHDHDDDHGKVANKGVKADTNTRDNGTEYNTDAGEINTRQVQVKGDNTINNFGPDDKKTRLITFTEWKVLRYSSIFSIYSNRFIAILCKH